MAVYEFKCLKCKDSFEIRQPMGSEHIADCPVCKGSKTQRVFTIPALNIITDSELSARSVGVPKARLEKMKELKDGRSKRKKDPKNEMEEASNELHVPKKKSDLKGG
jgi:putative FmdB family regulatory protein